MNGGFRVFAEFHLSSLLLLLVFIGSAHLQFEGIKLDMIVDTSLSTIWEQFDILVVDDSGSEIMPNLTLAHSRWDRFTTGNRSYSIPTSDLGKLLFFFKLSPTQDIVLTQISTIFNLLEYFEHRKQTNLICMLWLPDTGRRMIREIEESFPLHLLHLMSDFYIIQKSMSQNSLSLLEIKEMYAIKYLRIVQDINPNLNQLLSKASRRQDFRGVSICGAGLKYTSLDADVQYETINNGTIQFTTGYGVEKFRLLRDGLNFTEQDVFGTGFAHLDEHGKMTGLGRQIIDGQCDISIVSSEMVPFRMKQLTFLFTTEEEKLYAVFQQLPQSSFRDIYIHPLSKTLWFGYLGLWLFIVLSMMLILGSVILNTENTSTSQLYEIFKSVMSDLLSWVPATICQQGWYISAERLPVRIGVLSAVLSAVIVYVYYCASLVSLLSVHVLPVKSFQDILENEFVLYGENGTLAVDSLFKVYKENGVGVIEESNNCFMGAEEALEKILTRKSAFISPLYGIDGPLLSLNYSDFFLCKHLSRVELEGPPAKSGMFINRTSPLKEVLNYKLLQLIENGNHRRLKQKYPLDPVRCLRKKVSSTASIGFTDIFTAVLLMGSGFGISLCSLELEKLWESKHFK